MSHASPCVGCPVRRLPGNVLKKDYASKVHLESADVQRKFSSPDAVIGEANVDMVAMLYFSPEAVLYWLPRYVAYLKASTRQDSFHYEAMLYRLSDAAFVAPLREIASTDEVAVVCGYLEWWAWTLQAADRNVFTGRLRDAKRLWT